jgi:hypothetical protein
MLASAPSFWGIFANLLFPYKPEETTWTLAKRLEALAYPLLDLVETNWRAA